MTAYLTPARHKANGRSQETPHTIDVGQTLLIFTS